MIHADPETTPEPLQDERVDDVDGREDAAGSTFVEWLDRQQWVALVLFAAGIVVALVVGAGAGFVTMGAAVALAGLFPVVSGVYRSPFGTLRGTAARARGMVSVILGLVVVSIGVALL